MRDLIVVFCLAGLALVNSGWQVEAYMENFDDGAANEWEEVSGDWKIDDGQYAQLEAQAQGGGEARNRAAAYAVGNESWTDYTFEVKINPISTSNYAGVMFRVGALDGGPDGNTFRDTSEYYYWLIGIGGNYSKIWQAPACIALEETPGKTLIPGEWNQARVEMYDQNVKLFLDGEEQKDFDFPENVQIESGGVALATYNASIIFDDVKVEGPGLAVHHRRKLAATWAEIRLQ